MGFTSPIEEQYKNLNRLRNQLLSSQVINDSKLEISKKQISETSKKIEQGKNEIKQFCHSLTKEEMQIRGKELMELEKNLEIEKKSYETIINYNTILKTNISQIEHNMNELRMFKDIKDTNKELKKMELINTSAALAENVNIILNQKLREENINEEFKNVSQIYNANTKTTDAYLKEILGNTPKEENKEFIKLYNLFVKKILFEIFLVIYFYLRLKT